MVQFEIPTLFIKKANAQNKPLTCDLSLSLILFPNKLYN